MSGAMKQWDVATGELAQCLTTLDSAFGGFISAPRLNEAARRLSRAGFYKNYRESFLAQLESLDYPETHFLEKMVQRGFSVEQAIMF
jgi:hypothetical protein